MTTFFRIMGMLLLIAILTIAGCASKEAQKSVSQEQISVSSSEEPASKVDSTGLDTQTVSTEEKDLNTEELNDIDSGLSEIENI